MTLIAGAAVTFVEAMALAAAVICVSVVGVGFIVTRWTKFWSRNGRSGVLTCRD